MRPDPGGRRPQPLALITLTLLTLLAFSVFFLSFLIAPLAILAVFYTGFAATDRARRARGPERLAMTPEAELLAREALARRQDLDRADRTAL